MAQGVLHPLAALSLSTTCAILLDYIEQSTSACYLVPLFSVCQ